MKNKLTSSLILAAALATASHAQLTLHDFSSVASPQTLFFGDWSDTGDPFAGSEASSPLLTQGPGFFSIDGASNADTAYLEHVFTSSLNLGTADQLALSLRLLGSNTADSLSVFLLDGSSRTASATFLTSHFNESSFSEVALFLTPDAGFDITAVSGFRISGNDPFAGGFLGVEIDRLTGIGTFGSAVPEPSTYGLSGAAILLIVAARRKRTSRTS